MLKLFDGDIITSQGRQIRSITRKAHEQWLKIVYMS